eukprot:3991469-Ditylum_brightwellii.AAC.1
MAALHIALPVLANSAQPKLWEVALNTLMGLPLQNHCSAGPSRMWGSISTRRRCSERLLPVQRDTWLWTPTSRGRTLGYQNNTPAGLQKIAALDCAMPDSLMILS